MLSSRHQELLDTLARETGAIPIRMTNDYLFKVLLQENKTILSALVADLLHIKRDRIQNISVLNPIVVGHTYDEKDFVLDIKAEIENGPVINLELQVVNEGNWPERSMSYLARTFDNINSGEDYLSVKPAIHIGFLNFTLFEEYPEFYANYYLINEKTNHKYSDKLRLSVVDLTKVELATEEDRAYKIDLWARFFKCKEWGDIMALAAEDEVIAEAAAVVQKVSQDEQFRYICEAREDYYKRQNTARKKLLMAEQKLEKVEETLEEVRVLSARLQDKNVELQDKNVELQGKNVELQDKNVELQDKNVELQDKNVELQDKNVELQGKNVKLQDENEELQDEVKRLREELQKIKDNK